MTKRRYKERPAGNLYYLLGFGLLLCLFASLLVGMNSVQAVDFTAEPSEPTPQAPTGIDDTEPSQSPTAIPRADLLPSYDEMIAWPWKQENPEPKAKIQHFPAKISAQETISSADLSSLDQNFLESVSAHEATLQIRALTQFGGAAFRVTISGSYAYIGLGFKLGILDISNPSAISLVGKTESTWADQIVGIAVKGNIAYVAAGNEGLRIVDISDKQKPKEVGFYNTPGYAWDVAVEGNVAYVADSWMGVHLIDVTTPYAPRLLDTWQTDGKAMDILIDQNYAIIALESEGIQVVSLNNPAQSGSLKLNGRAVGLAFASPYIFVAGDTAGLRVVQMQASSSGIALTEIGHLETGGNAYAVAYSPVNEVVYIANSGRGLRAVNVSTPSSPNEVGNFDIAGCWANDIQLQGSYAYLIDTAHGLRVLNVANPKELSQVALFNAPAPTDVFFTATHAYLSSGSSGLRIIQLQKDKEPLEVGYFDTPGYAYALDVVSPVSSTKTYAYIADWDQGLRIVDVTSPAAPFEVGFVTDIGYARDVKVIFPYAYVAAENNGLVIIDLSATQPALLGHCPHDDLCLPIGGSTRGIAVSEGVNQTRIAYVADGEKGLCAIDVSDPAVPTRLSCYNNPGIANGVSLSSKLPYAYVAAGFSGGLQVVNISNPANLVSLGALDTEGAAIQVMAEESGDEDGDLVFIADGQDGLRMVFVDPSSSPPQLVERGYLNTRGWAGNLSVLEKRIMIADGVDGLRIVEVPSQILTHTVQGNIKDDKGQPLAGVVITLNNQPYTVTDAQGSYNLSDLKTGIYTITPVLSGYVFSPASYTLEVKDNVKDKNFYASRSLGSGLSLDGEEGGDQKSDLEGDESSASQEEPQDLNGSGATKDQQKESVEQAKPTESVSTGENTQDSQKLDQKPPVFSISGRVVDLEQQPLPGINIKTNCGTSTVTDSRGNFILSFEKSMDCQIMPDDEKYTFSPTKIELRAHTLTTNGILEGQQFIGIAKILRGQVVDDQGRGLAGVTIKVNNKLFMTDKDGWYQVSGLPSGTYTIEPTMENYSFSPSQLLVTIPLQGEVMPIVGKETWRKIQGKVLDAGGKPMGGVIIETAEGQLTQSDEKGMFSLTYPPQGTLLTPKKQGYVFTPPFFDLKNMQAAEALTFTADLQKIAIQGKVITSENIPLGQVTLRDNLGNQTITDAQGQYSMTIPYGSLSLQAEKEGYEFQPTLHLLDPSYQKTTYDFTAVAQVHSVQVKVKDSNGLPTEGVKLEAPNVSAWVTDKNGTALLQLKTGKTYITPSKNGYRFNPEVIELDLPGSKTNVEIIAQAMDFRVKGQVFDSEGMPLSQVQIKLADESQLVTDALGQFEVSLKPGNYALDISKEGYTFNPNNLKIAVPAENDSIIEIQGTPMCPNAIENGSFEKETGWGVAINRTLQGGARFAATEDGTPVIQGRRSAAIGVVEAGNKSVGHDAIRQKITIPKEAKSAVLRFWVYLTRVGEGTAHKNNVQMALILDENQKEVERLFSKNSNDRKWEFFQKDLSAYRGKTIWVYFGTYNEGKDTAVGMLVDDVSLQICQ